MSEPVVRKDYDFTALRQKASELRQGPKTSVYAVLALMEDVLAVLSGEAPEEKDDATERASTLPSAPNLEGANPSGVSGQGRGSTGSQEPAHSESAHGAGDEGRPPEKPEEEGVPF